MATQDLRLVLDALVSRLEGDERATAWAALTLHLVLASGRELTDRAVAARRSLELLERLELRETQGKRTTRLLIVEDDDPIAKAIARLLGHSCEIVRAVDGVAARDLLIAGASFDVILSDVNMPRLDGFGLLRWLRLSRPDLVDRAVFMTVDPDLPGSARDRSYPRPPRASETVHPQRAPRRSTRGAQRSARPGLLRAA